MDESFMVVAGIVLTIAIIIFMLRSFIKVIAVVAIIYILFHIGFVWQIGDIKDIGILGYLNPGYVDEVESKYSDFTEKRDAFGQIIDTDKISEDLKEDIKYTTGEIINKSSEVLKNQQQN